MASALWAALIDSWWFVPLGFVIGAYGALIGAGGGFMLVPLLLLLYPEENPDLITGISLAVVFANTLSGSLAYGRMKRIDYKSGIIFSMATIPGAILGALGTAYVSRRLFDAIFGFLMIAGSAFLLVRPTRISAPESKTSNNFKRTLVEADGTAHTFSYNPAVGIGLSLFVGFLSSFLGVGGGFIHVPALVHLLRFPVHIATATSHFILAIMTLTGTLVHVMTGVFSRGVQTTIFLAIGVLVGAQLGARLSTRVEGSWIIRALAVALAFVGIRLLL